MKATALRQLAVCAAVAATFLGPILPVQADYKSTILADTPAGYWRLGDMAVGQAPLLPSGDVAMNSSTVAGAPNGYYLYDTTHPAPGALAGSSDTAAAFDGFKHRVDVPYAALLNGTNFSIELWVRITNAVTRAVSPICSRDTNGQRGYVLFAYNGNTNWQFRTHSSGNATNLTSTNVIQVNEWTHLVGTFDGTRMRLYVNGAEAATPVTNTAFTPNTAAPLRLGAANNHTLAGDNFWPGSLDEVAVYTNALSATQVTAHYQNGTNASRSVAYETLVLSDGPVAYWRLNEAAYAGTTSPLAIQNAGSAGPAANGVILGITNSAVGIPFTTNGVIGGVSGALAGDSDPAVGFNGRDGRIDVPYNAALNPAKFTVEAWAYVPLFYRDYHT
ncbi:MAG TPA: LamG domain-containing protein, partial [Bacillota bacterium]|nr:LamG domain-containing protein [Bacillota bacterium]